MALDKWLTQLGKELDMQEFISQTETNQYVLTFNRGVLVKALQYDNGYFFKGEIGPCPEKDFDSLFMQLMEANLFGRGTRQAAIGLTDNEKILTLTLELDYNKTYNEFKEKLEDFVTVLEFWKQELLKHH